MFLNTAKQTRERTNNHLCEMCGEPWSYKEGEKKKASIHAIPTKSYKSPLLVVVVCAAYAEVL